MRALLVCVLLASGCVGQLENGPGDDDTPPAGAAKDTFKKSVFSVVGRCAGNGCHDQGGSSAAIGKFYTTDAESTYTAITRAVSIVGRFESIAPIITKIDSGHQGIVYSTSDRAAITSWLTAETNERRDNNQPPPPDPAELLKSFSACMTLDIFNAAEMPTKWGAMASTSGQRCAGCHSGGLYGFVASDVPDSYFAVMTSSMSQFVKYFSVTNDKVTINMGALQNAGTSIPDHPQFDPVNNVGMPALQQLYTMTAAAQTAAGGGCGPSRIVGP